MFERLNYRLHRFAWRTPLHALRLRGRVPLKLIAVPKDPIAGDKAAGEALLDGRFLHNGTEVAVAGLDFATIGLPEDFTDYLQSFAWLRDLSAAATRERGAKLAEGITRKWLAAIAEQIGEPAWRADLWGRRILFWTAYAPYILSSADPVYRSSLLYALARGARHLERTADKALPGLPRITAWSGRDRRRLWSSRAGRRGCKSGEAGLTRALGLSLHDDGGLVSRSPTEQIALVEMLGQLRAVYAAGAPRRAGLADRGAWPRRSAPCSSVTLGDERAVELAGRQYGEPPPGRRRGRGRRHATPARSARRAAGAISGVAGQGRACSSSTPRRRRRRGALKGACASTLAFELQRRAEPADRQLRRRRRGARRAARRPRPRAAHHRRPFDADARRPQFDRDPRGRLARQGRRRGRAGPRRDRRRQPDRGEP